MISGVKFRKCNILHFPTHGYPWDRQVYDVHGKLLSTAIKTYTANFDKIEDKHQKLSSAKGEVSVH